MSTDNNKLNVKSPYPQNVAVTIHLAGDLDETSRLISSGKVKPYVPSELDNTFASENNLKTLLVEGLKFPYFDFTYGVQDTLQTDYTTHTTFGAPEGYNTYGSTNNRVVEFMLRLFTESKEDVPKIHNTYMALHSLILPWLLNNGISLPPPKVRLIIGANVYATGYINSLTTTHYDPVTEIKLSNDKNAPYLQVMEFVEVVVSFTRQALTGQLLPYANAVGFVDGHMLGFGGIDKALTPE